MKKILFSLMVVLIAGTAWGADVDVYATCDANVVTVGFNAADVNVRALALDITVDGEGVIESVTSLQNVADYNIYPGKDGITIVDGSVSSLGVPVGNPNDHPDTLPGPGVDSNGVTIEMATLSEFMPLNVDVNLVEIVVGGSGTINVDVNENAIRGGVVLDDPSVDPTVSFTGCQIGAKCLQVGEMVGGNLITQEMRDLWESLGEPASWCYDCHYRGDTDGDCDVDADDVSVLVDGWGAYEPAADTDNDGDVDADDVANLVTGWNEGCGTCTPIP